jgi:deoxyhypusine synthase
MKTLNKIKKRWDKENEEIKALPRFLITIASIFLAVVIATIFMAVTGSFVGGGLAIIISYLIFKKLFEKLAIKMKK